MTERPVPPWARRLLKFADEFAKEHAAARAERRNDVERTARTIRTAAREVAKFERGEPLGEPRKRSARPRASSSAGATAATEPAPLKVLVVDDHAQQRELTTRQLRGQGMGVVSAETAIGMRAAIRSHRPDVVLLDVEMPDMRGPQAVRLAREVGITTRFVLYSALSESVLREEAQRSGANGWLSKTHDAAKLGEYVRRILKTTRP